jgi:hypothetical protein
MGSRGAPDRGEAGGALRLTGVRRLALAPLVLLAVTAARSEGPAVAPVPLEVAEKEWDAGTVRQGVTLRHDFVLKNVGAEPLDIDAKPG